MSKDAKPDLTAARGRTIALLGRLRQRSVKFMTERLREEGFAPLGPAHGAVVVLLEAKGALAMSDIAGRLEKRKPTVTALVRKLTEQGLVSREEDERDRRVVRIRITRRGARFARVFGEITREVTAKVTRGVPAKDQAVFVEVLEQLLSNLADYT